MRCLVTGAAGFIGSSLCDELLARGHEVIGVDRFTPYYPRPLKEANLAGARHRPGFSLFEADLVEADLLPLLDGVDLVFHLAAQPGVRASWEAGFDDYVRDNVLATQRLLEACRSAEPHRLVYASSSSIYGNVVELPVREEVCGLPVSPYGVSKLAAEHLCGVYHQVFGVAAVSVRYFTVYGPRQRPDMAFHRFIRAGLTGTEITIFGDGTQSRDFTFVSDAVGATIAAGMVGRAGGCYNVGGGAVWTIREVLDTIQELVGLKLNVRYVERSPGDVRDTSASTVRAREELGFDPATDVRTGLGKEVEWVRSALESGLLARQGSST